MTSFDLHMRLCSVDEKWGSVGVGDLLKITHTVTGVETEPETPRTISGVITPGHCSQQASPPASRSFGGE